MRRRRSGTGSYTAAAPYTAATLIDDDVRAGIARLTPLAPLHQPRAIAGIDAATAAFDGLPQVACFDTAFHATLPPHAYAYPLPAGWRTTYGLRKYGFHGLSHAYASRRAAELLNASDTRLDRIVTCHLGAGSSLAAVHGGHSVETTMGFTPVDGLVMATRPGSVDPGMVAWLADRIPAAELAGGLEHRSGLAGLAELPGGSGDYRDVAAAAASGNGAAALALDVHAHRLTAAIAAMAAAMNGLDALVFTGGIGEHAHVGAGPRGGRARFPWRRDRPERERRRQRRRRHHCGRRAGANPGGDRARRPGGRQGGHRCPARSPRRLVTSAANYAATASCSSAARNTPNPGPSAPSGAG